MKKTGDGCPENKRAEALADRGEPHADDRTTSGADETH